MKLKTVKSARKRVVRITSKGKILRRHLSAQHLATNKSKRTKKAADKLGVISSANAKKIKRLVPYR